MDCPWDIFLSARALKGVRGAPFKRTTTAQRERDSLFSRSNRSEVLLLLLFSSLVKSSFLTNKSHFSIHHTN